ncbi:ABC transporter permease [Nocardioides sp. YIM 152315]|uniref:ABC transporter permease n=1 Tax=Nocardioides sp. YIM 152315 TaxID=3031760 RepID=UPI0023DA0CF8|nr:ABC transporter permease [Nocardioides sp. YIM 152315]MDF1604663.1 ABC transporter permease [Nocardioides sp. YIM 152315]
MASAVRSRRVLQLVGRRLLTIVPLLVIVSLLTFSLVFLIPGDPAQRIAGESASPEQVEAVRTQLGLDLPVHEQFWNYLSGLAHGDLGTSFTFRTPVTELLLDRLPVTLSITVVAMVFALLIGIPAGVLAGRRAGRWQDRAVTVGSTLGLATPNFVLGLLLTLVVGIQLGWLPATGYQPLADGFWPWLQHLLMPGFALGVVAAAEIARQLRASLADVLRQDYVRTATAKGMLPGSVVWKHALKNAMMPVVTVVGLQVGYLLGGTAVIETVFGVKGLGDFAVQSVLAGDLPAIQGMVVFAVLIAVTASLLVDITYGYLNPRGGDA